MAEAQVRIGCSLVHTLITNEQGQADTAVLRTVLAHPQRTWRQEGPERFFRVERRPSENTRRGKHQSLA
jgi:hypothetical protein